MKILAFALFWTFVNAYGDRLVQSFPAFNPHALNVDELSADWKRESENCVPNVGYVYYPSENGQASAQHPLGLGYAETGQLASITINIDGKVPQQLIDAGWWLQRKDVNGDVVQDSMPYLTISLRENPCAFQTKATIVENNTGDVLTVNAGHLNWTIPLDAETARSSKKYAKGACVKRMGVHYIHDISNPGGAPSWIYGNLAPVVPMYDAFSGEINGIFFTSADVQQTLIKGTRGWDGIPLTGRLMCANFCSASCGFDEWFLSTMHIFFKDPDTFDCTGECTRLSCCDIDANAREDSSSLDSSSAVPMLSLFAATLALIQSV